MKRVLEKLFAPLHYREGLGVGLSLLFGLLTMTSCSEEDNPVNTASQEQYDAVSGHWFAELPISGETENWRTEEEGDMTTFNKVTAIFYLSDHLMKEGWWGYLYLQGDEMVNYGGIDLNKHENQFAYDMTADGHVTPSSHIENMPKVTNILYDSSKDVINANVTHNGQSYQLTFTRPDNGAWERLNEYFNILLEEGIVGGYDDGGDHINTVVTDKDATEQQRSRQF